VQALDEEELEGEGIVVSDEPIEEHPEVEDESDDGPADDEG
jgi:hypothetical protein